METRDIFEKMASRYDTQERVQIAGIIAAEIRGEMAGIRGGRALDYGCGTGLIGLALIDLFDSMLFVDTSPQMLERVKEKIAAEGTESAETLCGDFCAEPRADIRADCILLSQVLLHVREYPLLLRRLYAMLNDGGQLIIVDFDKNEGIVSDMVHNGFEQDALAQLLHEIGFSTANARTFYHGQKMFMNKDASFFILNAKKQVN